MGDQLLQIQGGCSCLFLFKFEQGVFVCFYAVLCVRWYLDSFGVVVTDTRTRVGFGHIMLRVQVQGISVPGNSNSHGARPVHQII